MNGRYFTLNESVLFWARYTENWNSYYLNLFRGHMGVTQTSERNRFAGRILFRS